MGCVNRSSKEFKNLAQDNNVDVNALELITHKYWIEKGSEDSFPSNVYIQEQLGNVQYKEPGANVRKLWKEKYSTAKEFSSIEELQAAKEKALKFFPESAIVHYKDSKGNYILTVKQPVEKIKYVAAKPISEELANARTLDLGLDNTETYSIGKVRELFDKFNTDKESKRLADKVFNLAESLGLKFIFDESLPINTLGRYGSSGVIKYRKSFFERDMFGDKKAPILLHEVIHAVSMYALSNKVKEEELPKALQDFRKEISKIYNEIKDNESLKGERGILDEKEMVAELSSPVFREKLKKIERDKESFWTKIVNIFKSLFGIRVNNPSSRLMKALENAMSAFDNDLYLRYSGALGVLREGQRENEWQFREMTAEEMRKAIKDHYIKKYYNNKLAERTKIRLKYARKRAFSESKEYSYLPYGRTDLEIPKKVAELRKREFLDDYGDLVQIAITTNDDEKDPDKPKKQPELVGYSFFVKFKTPKQLLDDQNRNLLNWLKILDDMSASDLQGYFAKMEQEYADYEMLHPEAKKKGSEYELQLAMESNSQKGAHPFTFNDGTQILAPFKLNDEQAAAINALDDFVRSNETSITLSGYAGTGKTSIMELFAKKMRQDWKPVAFTASTNKAAIVLKNRVEKAGFRATTLNKAFGIAVEPNDKVDYDAKNLVTKLRRADIDYGTVVVIDEASMISDDNYDILNRIAAEKGLKLIYVGDPKQLAPPKQNNISKVFRNGNGKVLGLTKVERTGQNPILREATDIRNGKPLSGISDFTEDSKGVAYMKPTDNASIDDVIKYYIQGLKDNPDFFRILAFRNKTVAAYNNRVRRALGYRGFIPNVGEPILGYANWGFIPETGDYRFINSESYKVTRVVPERIKTFGINGKKYELKVNTLSIEDSQGRTDQINYVDIKGNEQNRVVATELAKVKDALWAEWRRTPKTKANKEKLQRIKDDINYIEQGLFVNDNIMMGKRTLQSKVVDFGYAMTVHKSQGSTFTHVLMDDVDISVARNQSPQALDEVLLGIDDGVVPDYANSTLTETEDVDLQVNPDHTDVRQQLEYVAMSRATDTVTVISNNVKVPDSPLIQATRKKSGTQTATQRVTPTTTQQVTSTAATAQKKEVATPPSISTTTKTPAINNEEVWKHMSQRETPKGRRETHYTPVGQTDKRTYTVENGHIYNKEGKEVYQGESADRNKILAQLALDEDRAVRVNYRGIDYVVDNNQVITSLKTGNIMKWGKENGDRKAIIELATQRFRDYITQGKKSLATQAIDHLVTEGYDVGDEVDMQNYLANHPISSAVRAMEARKEIQEMNEIKAKAQADGTFMKAPNGKPTNLNERQWLQVRTKNFIKWFGNWEEYAKLKNLHDKYKSSIDIDDTKERELWRKADRASFSSSAVIDENGEPLVVYHYNTHGKSDIRVFDENKSPNGFWATTNSSPENIYFPNNPGENVVSYPVFLNIRRDDINDMTNETPVIENGKIIGAPQMIPVSSEQIQKIKKWGQSIMQKWTKDETFYAVFNPNQIKSATNNNGMFSTENDDIQMAIEGNIDRGNNALTSPNIQKYTTPEGEVYGFVDENGKIYLDKRVITAEHPMHEFTHLWDRMVQQKNPELWKRGVDLMKQLPQWKEILEDENYGKKWVEKGMSQEQLDNYVASEVHSRLVGDQGNRLLENLGKKKGYKRIINKLKEWIKDMWKNLHKTFGNWTDEELNTLTLKDFNRMTIRDFTQAKDFKEAFGDQVSDSPVDSAKRDATVSKIESYVEWQKQHITFDKNSHKYFFDGQPIDYSVTEYGQQVFGPKNIEGDHSYALAMGNAVDALTRDFFIIGEKALEKYYPNLTDERKAAIVSDLRRLKTHLDKEFHNNYKVITTEFPIAARISTPNGEKTIGGTLDMLIVDGEGNLHIFDMKAKNHAIDAEFFDKTTGQYKKVDDRRDYTFQLNGYRQILEALFPEFKNKIVDLRLIWFDTDYTRQNKGAVYTTHKESGIVTVKEDGSTTSIPLAEYGKWLTPSLKSKVEDSLLPLSRQESLSNVRPIQENWNKGQEAKPQQPQDNINLHYENYNKRYTPRESSSIPILNEKAAALRASGWHIEFYDKKSQDGSITNEVMTISLGQRNKGFFELVKDVDLATGLPNNDYSVHFKTKSKKGLGGDKLATVPLTDVEKKAMFEALAWAIPDGANVSTWGELSEGGIHALDRFKEFGFTQTGTRKVKHKNGGDLTIPVLTKGAVQQTSAQQQTQTRKLTSEEVYTKLKEQYPENSSERKLLDLVFPSLKIADTKFKEVSEIYADGISVVTGQYVPAENTIYYNKEHLGVNTLLHEAIHAVTSYYMQAADTSKFSKEINVAIAEIHECWNLLREDYIENVIRPKQGETVSNAAYRSWVIDDLYGLSSPTELVAEISNPELLQHIRDYDKRHKGKNIFQRLVDAIANLFGVNKSYSSLEKTLKDALVKLITSPNKELMDRYTLEAKTFKENVKKINESASVKFGVSEAWPKLYLYPQIKDESSRSYADFNLVVSDEMLRNILDIEKGVTIPISGSEIGTIITIPSSNIIMTLNGKPILSESEKTATIPLRIYNGDFFQLNTFDIKKGNNGANYITNIKPLFSTQQTNTQQQAQQQQTTLPGPETNMNIHFSAKDNTGLSNFAERPFNAHDAFFLFGRINPEWSDVLERVGEFKTVEGAFQAMKVFYSSYTTNKLGENPLSKEGWDTLEKLANANGVEARSIGRNIPNLSRDNWNNNSSYFMKPLIKMSFTSNPQALRELLATGDANLTHLSTAQKAMTPEQLAEAKKRDKWIEEFPKLLMEVRKELREEHPELMPGQPASQQQKLKEAEQTEGKDAVDRTIQSMQNGDNPLTPQEQKTAAKTLGTVRPKVLMASEHSDPVFHAKKIIQRVNEELKKPAKERSFHMLQIMTKHDGLPLRDLLELKIPKLVHFSITSLGNTKYEPGVMKADDLLDRIEAFIKEGILNPGLVTVRIDPIVPGVTKSEDVEHIVERASKMGIKNFKFSVMDSYGYTDGAGNRDRFIIKKMSELGYDWDTYYGRNRQGKVEYDAKPKYLNEIFTFMDKLADKYKIRFNTCGEKPKNISIPLKNINFSVGCLNAKAVNTTLGVNDVEDFRGNQRDGCSCYGGKVDALRYDDTCASSCVYCYASHNSDSALKYYDENGNLKDNVLTRTSRNQQQDTIKPPVTKLEKGTWSADYVYKELKKQYPEGTPMSKLVDMVFKALEETGTVFEAADLGTTRSGRFIGSENKVQYNINAIRENTILHESIHAVTSYYLKAVDPKVFSPEIQTAIEEIKECHRILKEDFIQNHFYENGKLKDGIDLETAFVFHTKGSVTDYGFLNPSEMVAEMSNPEFLEQIRDFDRRHKGQNIFNRLINAVASLLGLRKNYTTVEDTIKKALETLITNPSKEMAEKYAEQNRNYKNNTTNLNKSNRILINNKDAIDKFFKTVPEDFSEEWIDTTLELDAKNPQLYTSYDPEGRFTWEDAPVGSIMVYNSSTYFMLSDTPKTVGNKVQIKVRAISAKGLKMNSLNIKRDEVTGIDYVESAKPLFAFPVGSIADIPSSKNKPEVTQAEGNTEPASKTQKLKTVSLPGYQYYKEMTADTTVDAEWKIPLLKALDAKLNDETPLAELNDTLEKMDKILKAESEEDINKPEPEQNEKERQVLSEYERITTQINNLLDSDVISASEVRHVAELIMNSISDNITALQTTEGLAKEQFPSLNTDLDFKTASRKEIVAAVGINRLIARAKAIFEKTDYEDFEAYEQAPVIIENWEALMLLAADQFAANEGFGIVKDPTSNKFETTKDADDIGFDEFTKHNDEDAKNEEEGDEQERWQIESRTIDILRSMSELVRIGLHNCYQMEYYFDEQGQRKTRKVYSKWGIAERVNPRQAVNNILRWTQGALTLQEMVDMLKTKMEDNPWVEQLIDRLEIKEGQVNNDTDFQSQFFGVMSKHFQLYSIVLGEDGKYHSMEVNRKPALKEARNTVITQYQIGQHPLFTSNRTIKKELLGTIHTANSNNNFNLHKALTALQIINKAWKENGEISEEMLTSAIENVVGVSRLLGYQVNEDIVEQAMNEKSLTKMTVALGYMVRKLDNEVKVQEDLQRQGKIGEYSDIFAYDNTGSIRGDLTNFLEPITEVLEDSSISAFYDSGKMYQSYVTPSFLTKLMNKFHMADAEKFKEFIEDEYGFSEWYKDKNGWRNEWLEELASDPETRKIFEHKVELNFNKHNYMRNMSDAEYTLSLLTEYFSVKKGNNATKVPAWFRMPMQSNKPSSEYIKFWSYRGDDYKENIVYGMLKMFNQELSRINTVMKRNPEGAKKRADFIKNFDTNGRKFNYLPFLNPYLENTAEAKAKRTLFESADKNNEFAKLLQEKLNSKDLKDAEGTLKTLAEEAIFNHMQKRANSILDAWEKSGILAAAKKVEGIGKSKEAIRASVENFLWNDNYAAKNILQLTIGDIAFYKDAEDLQKRLAQLHAPGTRANIAATDYKGNRVSDGTYRTFILKDFDSFRSNIIANIEEVFDRKIAAARPEDRPQLEALKDSLVRKPGTNGEDDKGGAYYKINVADAQGFCSPSSYRKKAFLFGKWSKKAENIYEKLLAGEVNYTDLETAFQPLKPFVYSKLKKDMGVEGAPITKMPVPFQAKNAEYLLIMADAIIKNEVNKSGELSRPNLLRAVYRVMEESEQLHPREGIDTVQFESAIKSGLQGAIDISVFAEMEGGEESAYKYMSDKIYKKRYFRNKQTGEVRTQYDYKVNETVHEASYEDYCLQQEVPPHFQNHSQAHGSQVRMIIPSDLDLYVDDTLKGAALTDPSNRIYYEITEPDGTVKKLTAEQFRKEYEDTISEGIEESLEELNDELLLYKKEINPETGELVTVKNSNRRERNIALSKILQREILSSPRYGVDLIQACSIDRRTGEFRIPKGDPIQAKRIEQLINSIIKNRVNKQKIAGGPIVQVSNFGTSKQLQIRFKDKQGNLLMSRSEFAAKNKNLSEEELSAKYKEFIKKNQGGIAYFEVFAPIWSKDLFHKFADVNGNIDIKAIEMVAPELLEMVSYRIPTEDKYSCAPMRVVGFMPKEAGDAIMLPWELTEIDDSDFDVDKRYVMRKEIDIYTRFEPKENQTMIEAEKEYIKHNREGIYKYLRKHVAPRITEEDKKMLAKIEKQVKSEFDIDRRTQEKEHERRLDEITKVSSLIDESNNRANEKRQISDKQWEKRDDKEESRYQRQVDKENERFKLQMDLIDSREQSEINKRYNTWLGNSFNERLDDFLTYTKFFSSEQDDAMTREIREAYMKYMYKAIKPTKYTNAKAYRNNKIIDMSLAVLTHERTADKILNPGGFEAPKRVGYMVAAYRNPANNLSWKELQNIKDTDELKKLCYADKDLTWADTQVQFYKQNSAAASLIGVFAVNKVAHATLESDGIWLAVDEICGDKSFTIGDTTFGGMMEIDKKFDSKGTLIGKTLGSLVSASADAVKDPILNLMNINMTTAGMLNTMLRLGMPFEEAALFLSQDVVGRLLDRFNRENLTNYVSLSSIIEKMLKEASTDKDAEGNDIDLGFSNDSKITDAPITKEDMIKGLTADSHKDIDYKVLLAFEKIRGLTDAMRKPTFATRFNSISSAVGPLIVDNLILERKMNSFTYDGKNSTHFYKSKGDRTSPAWVTENMVTIDTIHEKHPILKSFAKTVEYARDMFEDMPAGSEGFRNFLATIPGDTLDKIFGDKKLFSQLSDFYQSFMLIASGVVDQKHLKTSIEGFPTYFVKGGFKEKYPDNALIQAITLSKGKNAKYPVLQIQLTGLDEAQKEVYRNAWIDIHKDNPTLSRRLFEYCFFRAGIGFSPKTFMALVPTYVKERLETDLGNGRKTSYVKTYEKLSTENMSAEVMYDQFIRNNWNENKLVPKKKGDSFRFNTEKIRNEITGRIEDIDALYITSKEDVSDVEGNMYIKVKRGKEYQLWKFDRRQGDKLIYHRTSPLGNNGEYLEINTSNIISPMNVTTALKENSEETGMPNISAAESDANDTAKKKLISEAETAKRIERAVEKYMSGEADDYLTNGVPTLFEEHFSMMRSIMDNRLTEQGIEIDKDKFMDEYNKYC